jgi:hypothetical protein
MRLSNTFSHRSWLVLLALTATALATLACGFEGGAFGSTPTPSGAMGATSNVLPAGANAVPQPSAGAVPDLTQGPMEAILITSPQPGQGVRGSLKLEGLSDPALADRLNVVVRDAQGTVIATARPAAQASAPAGQRSAFSADVSVPLEVPRQTGRVQVYAAAPGNNGVTHLASVEVELNGDGQAAAVPIDPQTPEAIAMVFPSPNAEVKGAVRVAAVTMLGPSIVIEVIDANNQTVGRVEQSVAQAAGSPAQVMVEVPIQVSAAGPGRVLVYALNARDKQTEHLGSVEVNLLP